MGKASPQISTPQVIIHVGAMTFGLSADTPPPPYQAQNPNSPASSIGGDNVPHQSPQQQQQQPHPPTQQQQQGSHGNQDNNAMDTSSSGPTPHQAQTSHGHPIGEHHPAQFILSVWRYPAPWSRFGVELWWYINDPCNVTDSSLICNCFANYVILCAQYHPVA